MFVPKLALLWIFVSNIIILIDAFFVINRPETLKGGKYYGFYQLYEHYYKFDTLYAMNEDKFVVIQSWLNVCEAIIAFIATFLCFSSCRTKRAIGAVLCFMVSAFVFWKTVIFVWYDHDWLTPDALSFTPESIFCYYFPSSLWIFLPLLCMIGIGRRFVKILGQKEEHQA